MGKHTSIDLKQTSNRVAPQPGFVRLVMGNDNNLYYHYDNSNLILATTPWNLPVENYTTQDPALLTPGLWDRYVIAPSALGDWLGLDNQIAQWNGSGWNYFIPEEGWCIYNKDTNILLGFNNIIWEPIGSPSDNITISTNNSNETTINEIDYIIDSDGLSIDSSNTPMSNANHELVTRDYVNNYGARTDNLTIEKVLGHAPVGTTNDEDEIFRESWFPGCNDSEINNGFVLNNGVIYCPPLESKLVSTYTDPPQPRPANDTKPFLDAGTYRLYCNIDLVPYGIKLETDSYWSPHIEYYGTSREESGYWLHEFVVPTSGTFRLHAISVDNVTQPSAYIQLIIQGTYPVTILQDITNVGVDKIIGADGYSLDAFALKATNNKRELVTREYVDKTKNNPDDLTIEGNALGFIPYSTGITDHNLLMEDAFKHGISTTGWTIWAGDATNPNPATIVDGVLYTNYVPQPNPNSPYWNNHLLLTNNFGPDIEENFNVYVITNINWELEIPVNNVLIITSDAYSIGFDEQIDIGGGEYLLRFHIPKGSEKRIRGFAMQIMTGRAPTPLVSPYFKFVKFEDYPPNTVIKIKEIDYIIDDDGESIDGSDTPMVDANHELVTRAYVDSVQIAADDITIESHTGFRETGMENTFSELIVNNWMNTMSTVVSDYVANPVDNGNFNVMINDDAPWSGYTGTIVTWDAGIYEFYCTRNLENSDVYLYDNNSGTEIYFTAVFENGRYRHSLTLVGTEEIISLGCNDEDFNDEPAIINFINRYNSVTEPEITVLGINKIIDANENSIDNTNVPSNDSKSELVTKKYVDTFISDADDITLKTVTDLVPLITEPDFNAVFTIWDSTVPNSGWTLDSNVTYTPGVFTIPIGITFINILTHSNFIFGNGGYFRFYSNFNFLGGGLHFKLSSSLNPSVFGYGNKLLSNGEFEYKVFIPKNFECDTFSIDFGIPLTSDCYIRFIDMDQYPVKNITKIKEIDYIIDDDGESIDGSDTPMVDANHELVTRAYVDDITSLNEYTVILNGTDIINGYIDLGISINNIFDFKIQGAGEQIETFDFQIGVPDTRISWSGLGLDGQLRAGHTVSVLYK